MMLSDSGEKELNPPHTSMSTPMSPRRKSDWVPVIFQSRSSPGPSRPTRVPPVPTKTATSSRAHSVVFFTLPEAWPTTSATPVTSSEPLAAIGPAAGTMPNWPASRGNDPSEPSGVMVTPERELELWMSDSPPGDHPGPKRSRDVWPPEEKTPIHVAAVAPLTPVVTMLVSTCRVVSRRPRPPT